MDGNSGGSGTIPPEEALSVFVRLEDPAAPLTATEVADELGCARRTAYNKLERLAERGELASKKVGARGRVWWRPVDRRRGMDGDAEGGSDGRGAGSFFEQVLNGMPEAVYVFDEDGPLWWNDRVSSITGYDDEAISGMGPTDFVPGGEEELVEEMFETAMDSERIVTREAHLATEDGDRIPAEFKGSVVTDDDGGIRAMIGTGSDIRGRRERERRLSALHESTRRLMDATAREEVAGIGVEAAESVLGLEIAAFYEVEDGGSALVPIAATDGAREQFRAIPTIERGEGIAWTVLESGDPVVADDVHEHPDVYNPDTPVRSEMILPVGDRTVFMAASTEAGAFDESDESLAKVLVSNAEGAFERARRERLLRERREELERYETMVNRSGDMIYATDADGRLTAVNDAVTSFAGYSRDEVLGEHASIYVSEGTVPRARAAISDLLEGSEGDTATYEVEMITADGERVLCEDHLSLLPPGENGEFQGTVGVIRDITERRERERRLNALHDASRRFMDAETREGVAEIAVQAARRILDLPLSAIWFSDDDAGVLRPTAWTDEVEEYHGRLPAYTEENSITGQVFAAGESRVYDDISEDPDRSMAMTNPRSMALLPLGDYGVLNVGALGVDSLSDIDVSSAHLLATNVEAALSRAEREEERTRYREELERQRDELSTLNRINALIEDALHSMMTATSRDEIYRVVCERLAGSELYENAWVAEHGADGDGIVLRASGGAEDGFARAIEEVDPDAMRAGGVHDALETGDVRVVQSMADDPIVPEEVRELALSRGYRSCVVSPLVYADTVYGALVVNASRPNAFRDRARTAFETLGRAIGFAINAVHNRNLVLADTAVELEFEVTDAGSMFVSITDRLECTMALEGTVPVGEESILVYATVDGAAPEAVLDLIEGKPGLSDPRVVGEHGEEFLLECVVSDSSPFLSAADYGAAVPGAHADRGVGEFVMRVAPTTDVREVVASVRSDLPGSTLIGKREVESSPQSLSAVRESILDRLTDRQFAALRAAFLAGYYDSPRGSTAQEVAASLDIASSTFHQHIQAAQRKMLEAVLDASPT